MAGGKKARAAPMAAPASERTAHAGKSASPFSAWLRLVRIQHALLSALGVAVGLLIAQKSMWQQAVGGAVGTNCVGAGNCAAGLFPAPMIWLLALLVPVLINIGAFALNDYFDIQADKANKRMERPLVNGELKPSVAIWTAAVGLFLGVLAGFAINANVGIVALLFALLAIVYNYKLKEWPLIGNFYIALSMAIAFPFGALAAGMNWNAMPAATILLFWGALMAGSGREIVKSAQDMEGDKKARGAKTLPLIIGERASLRVAAICYFVFVAVCVMLLPLDGMLPREMREYARNVLPYVPFSWNYVSLGMLALSALIFLVMGAQLALQSPTPKMYERWRRWSLGALALALLAVGWAAL